MKTEDLFLFMDAPLKQDSSPLSSPEEQRAFVQDATDAIGLLRKEIMVNKAEQGLLGQRIRLMKDYVNDFSAAKDPHYSMLMAQIQMDQIELDELKRREVSIVEQIETLSA